MSIDVVNCAKRREDCAHCCDNAGDDNGQLQQQHHQQNGNIRFSAVWTATKATTTAVDQQEQGSNCQIKIIDTSPPATDHFKSVSTSKMATSSERRGDGGDSSTFSIQITRLFHNKLFALFATALLVLITSAILLFIIVVYYQLSGEGGGDGSVSVVDSVEKMERAI